MFHLTLKPEWPVSVEQIIKSKNMDTQKKEVLWADILDTS